MKKTLTFAALHFTVAFSIGWLLTGNFWIGGALAVIEPACNTVVFYFHEKVWHRIETRRQTKTVETDSRFKDPVAV